MTFEDGKIVCVQKAIKEGQKSTKVIMITMMLLLIKVMMVAKKEGQKSTKVTMVDIYNNEDQNK